LCTLAAFEVVGLLCIPVCPNQQQSNVYSQTFAVMYHEQ